MEDRRVRVMTYNIHSCVGMDGRVAPNATADAIRLLEPDVAALQEVDDGIPKTGRLDQARYLGDQLGFGHIFCPTVHHAEGRYGLAVLCRFPMRQIRCGRLPIFWPFRLQKRGAVHAVVDSPAGRFHFFNTHLSLFGPERLLQVRHLMRKRWLGSVPAGEPVVFCADLNSVPGLPVYRLMTTLYTDVQNAFCKRPEKARPTFSSRRPRLRLDHRFVSPAFEVLRAEVPAGVPFRNVSDHLPLYADLRLRPEAEKGLSNPNTGGGEGK